MSDPTLQLGSLKRLSIKTIWEHEATKFTPWLAQHIDQLGKLIGLDLEVTTTEANVGEFFLDLLCIDVSTGKKVVIENQFNPTDHKHLGQLITYAAYYNAGIVIWLSESVREEHRAAIDWLNSLTDESTQFFAVEIEVIQIDDSKPAANFKIKAYPNEWRRTVRKDPQTKPSPRMELYREFFQRLLDELREKHQFTNAKKGQPQSWYTYSTGIKGFVYSTSFAQGNRVRAELYIDLGDGEQNSRAFEILSKQKNQIEEELGKDLEWERMESKRACRIAVYMDGSVEDSETKKKEIHDWLIDWMLKLKEALPKYLQQI